MNEKYLELAKYLAPAYDEDLTPEKVVRKSLKNYRQGKGMSLTTDAYQFLKNKPHYSFMKFEMKADLDSRQLVWLDKHSETPYYIGRTYIYLSDPMHQFNFSMGETLDDFIDYLKNIG